MMKRILKNALRRWLQEGTVRRAWVGPYRGLRFGVSAPLRQRLGVFYRSYEPNVTTWLQANVRPGMTVYVVGAHIGLHVLQIARLLRGQGHIAAFEGWPENYAGLTWNIDLNSDLGVDITPLPQCIARQPGLVTMAKGSSDGKHHIAAGGETETLQVEATSLDAFWLQSGRCPDLILMDIEGYELEALKGGLALLQACKPRLALEHHDQAQALIDWLKTQGYAIETEDRRHVFAR